MEPPKSHKKPSMKHGICSHKIFLSQGKANYNSLDPENQDREILLKYFPKHIANLNFKFADGYLNTRIKRLKLIKNLSCEENPHPNFWRLVVANKNKTVQSIIKNENMYERKYTKLNFQWLKMLPFLKNLTLGDDYLENISLEEIHWMHRSLCYLNHLNSLKYLGLSVPGQNIFPLLGKIKDSQRILSNLEVFKVGLSWPDSHNLDFMPKFLTYKKSLKHITDLIILSDKGLFGTFEQLPENCPKLSSLFFRTHQELGLETISLKSLKDFNLKKLHLCTHDGPNHLKNLIFSKSIRHLVLAFAEIDWETFMDNPSDLVAFDIQPENLQSLEVLKIYFTDSPDEIKKGQFTHQHHLAMEIFIRDLLQKIPACKKIYLTLSPPYSDHKLKESPFVFDFSQFLKSIEHLSHSLEVLSINDTYREYCLADFKSQLFVFPKLSSLSISTEIPSALEFESLINVCQVQASIKLEQIIVESCERLLNLLKKIGEMSNITAHKRVEMVISAQNLDVDQQYFEENYLDVKKEIRGRKNIFVVIKLRSFKFDFIRELESFQPLFGDFKVQDAL